ncbi:ABC transporter [Colletotrichum truncatum]|uniref:ABC transporter n=1 Tax=Colletotrichum truncatum TaxID=5467 RepID=A0ACC3YDC1_COLTU|nr:ABC transporter [Colletotrichum truncatum]KAF6784826.1 ABC transporter [Colletotrichum truncatum]
MGLTGCLNDDAFGPAVQGCRGDFDFTQKFERIFFWLVPAAIFIPAAALRLIQLLSRPRLVEASVLQLIKTGSLTVLAALQLCLLVLVCATKAVAAASELSIAALCLVLVAHLLMLLVSHLEHARCRRPSFILNIYLFLTVLFDMVQTRTLWLAATTTHEITFTRVFTASLALKIPILILEAYEKARWIAPDGIEHSPEESSGFYSLATYFWLKRLFWTGYRKVLVSDDLYSLDAALSAGATAPPLWGKLHRDSKGDQQQTVLRSLFAAFPWAFLLPMIPRAALIGFRYSQSFVLQALLNHLERQREGAANNGYGLIGACVLVYVGMVTSTAYFGYLNNRAAYITRACLCATVYQKTTELNLSKANDASSLTLMSTDVEHIETGLLQMHQIWGGLVEVAIGCWLLYTNIGVAFLVPLGLVILCTFLLYGAMMFVPKRQTVWMEKIQTRVAVTASAIADMKTFKILGVAGRVADMVQNHRAEEISAGNQFRVLMLVSVVLSYMPISLSPVVAFAATSRTLDVSRLFVSLSFIMLLSSPLLTLFQAVPVFLAGLASFRRIDEYLAQPRQSDYRQFSSRDTRPDTETDEHKSHSAASETSSRIDGKSGLVSSSVIETRPAFVATNASFGWEEGSMILRDLDFVIPRGSITMIVGPTASGKSTLCHALLGEIPIATGSLTAGIPDSAIIAYCAQTAYLSSGTVKENVVGFLPFSQKKYESVMEAAMLNIDVASLPSGHDTDIGSNGIKLSGGQRQRLSLARALYLESEISVFDDALSGLDAETEAKVFDRVFGLSGLIRSRGGTAVCFGNSSRHLGFADHIIVLGKDGSIVKQGSAEMFNDDPNNNSTLLLIDQVDASSADLVASKDAQGAEDDDTPVTKSEVKEPAQSENEGDESDILGNEARKTGDFTVYLYYLRSTTKVATILVLLSSLIAGFCTNFSTVWMSYWAEDSLHRPNAFYLGIYGMLRGTELIGIFGASAFLLIAIVTSSGLNLHSQAITTVIRAPLTLFTNTDTGTVTNLFSQDMTIIDGELPMALLNACLVFFDLLGNCFVIAVASPYIIASYPVLVAILYFIQMFYLRTSRQLRLLSLEAKSPLYSHFLDTMRGLATVRAHGTTPQNITMNNKILDTSQRPGYLLAMIQQWLSTVLLALVGLIATVITVLATQLRTNSGFAGASFVTLMTLSAAISELMQGYTSVETSIGAVSRLRAFSQNIKPEDEADDDAELPPNWPSRGEIRLTDVSASYSVNGVATEDAAKTLALSNLSLSIAPGEKIAICGRTGSGKSSLMLLLLRLLEPLPSSSHTLEVDSVALGRVNRTALRQRIITIPQDPVLLPGDATIKENLDYLGGATDEDCMSVIETAQLADFVKESGGMDAKMCADKLSSGQKQLFSLARAMLRRRTKQQQQESGTSSTDGGLLLVDELNSRLDADTDRLIQDVIRKDFATYTVIVIAHRLDIVMNLCDRVFVLDKGQVVEVDDPKVLVDAKQSQFSKLYHGGGGT